MIWLDWENLVTITFPCILVKGGLMSFLFLSCNNPFFILKFQTSGLGYLVGLCIKKQNSLKERKDFHTPDCRPTSQARDRRCHDLMYWLFIFSVPEQRWSQAAHRAIPKHSFTAQPKGMNKCIRRKESILEDVWISLWKQNYYLVRNLIF